MLIAYLTNIQVMKHKLAADPDIPAGLREAAHGLRLSHSSEQARAVGRMLVEGFSDNSLRWLVAQRKFLIPNSAN